MTAAPLVVAAPDPAAPESPVADPTTGVGRSEAMIVAAVLAEHGDTAFSCLGMAASEERAHTVVRRVLMHTGHDEVLAWRQRVPLAEHGRRWEAARTAASTFYPHLPGVGELPDLVQLDNAVMPVD
jgi:hypothetical protein